jgi:hypothetical protein
MDALSCAVHLDKRGSTGDIPEPFCKSNILKFIPKPDALIRLLAATADALAATKNLMEDRTGPGVKPTIQRDVDSVLRETARHVNEWQR